MGFKENLLRKIEIDRIAAKILASIGPPDSELKMDKEAVRRLLEMSPYRHQKERDLDLYIFDPEGAKSKILVLDNELPLYRTTPEDVGLRRSPTLKEMISIRNALKILNDADVKMSKKEKSVEVLKNDCIGLLDLSFGTSDIEGIAQDGIKSLERGYVDGVLEALLLLCEILGFTPVPGSIKPGHHEIIGKLEKNEKGGYVLGPAVMYNKMDNSLKMVSGGISGAGAKILDALKAVSSGDEKADMEGSAVFHHLAGKVEIRHLP